MNATGSAARAAGVAAPAAWLSLAALAFMWGTAFFVTRVAVDALAPAVVVSARLSFAALALDGVRRVLGLPAPRGARAWLGFVPLALTGSVLPFWLISWGQQEVASGLAGILMAVSPLVTVCLAHFAVSSEPLGTARLLGVALGLSGVVVLLGPASLQGLGDADTLPRQLAVLGGAVLYAVNTVMTRRFPSLHPIVFAAGVLRVAAVIALPLGLAAASPTDWGAPPGAWAAVAWLGLVPTGVATLVHYRLVSSEGAGFASQVSFAVPVVAVFAGAAAFGEQIEPAALAALVLVLVGLGVARGGGRIARATAGRALVRRSAHGDAGA